MEGVEDSCVWVEGCVRKWSDGGCDHDGKWSEGGSSRDVGCDCEGKRSDGGCDDDGSQVSANEIGKDDRALLSYPTLPS